MRFKLTLEVDSQAFGNALPLNYQYEQSAAIYRILSSADSDFSAWLHNNGFSLGKKQFKLFTYSRLLIPQYGIDTRQRVMLIHSGEVEWHLSFLPEITTENFIKGLFQNRSFQLGDKKHVVQFKIKGIELLPPPTFSASGMTFETLSPICISHHTPDGKTQYLSPDAPTAQTGLLQGLLNRYEAYHGCPYPAPVADIPYHFQVLTPPKPVLITIKAGRPEQTQIKGYLCKFHISAPDDLLKILYDSGAGEKGSLGFGCVRGV